MLAYLALRIWMPGYSSSHEMSIADRIAWSVFVLGICLMFLMALYAMVSESDGDFRTWETIRLHQRMFLGLAMIPIAGPLFVFLYQVAKALCGDKDPDEDES